jgi:hypothetical protein
LQRRVTSDAARNINLQSVEDVRRTSGDIAGAIEKVRRASVGTKTETRITASLQDISGVVSTAGRTAHAVSDAGNRYRNFIRRRIDTASQAGVSRAATSSKHLQSTPKVRPRIETIAEEN